MNAEAKDAAPAQTNPPPALKDELAVLSAEVVKVLPKHIGEEKFMRVVATAIATNPDLRTADRRSLYTAVVKAATDGLVPDGREGVFTIYNTNVAPRGAPPDWRKQVQWMPMIAGILKKVRNSGELKSFTSNVVKQADHFKYWIDDDGEHVQHEPNVLVPDRGETVAVYAIAKTINGGVYTEVMSRGQIDQVRNVSKSKDSGPWGPWYDEMARKAVSRRLSKRLPMSTDLEQVFQRDDDHYDLNRPQTVKADSGVTAARAALGLLGDAAGGDPQPPVNGAGTYVPQYTAETAIAEVKGTTTVAQLNGLAEQITDDYVKSAREFPIEVDAAINDHRAALEQRADQQPQASAGGKGRKS